MDGDNGDDSVNSGEDKNGVSHDHATPIISIHPLISIHLHNHGLMKRISNSSH